MAEAIQFHPVPESVLRLASLIEECRRDLGAFGSCVIHTDADGKGSHVPLNEFRLP